MLLNYQQTKVKAGRIRKYQAILPNKREETIIAQKTKKSSSDKAKKIQWHPAFYAAAELELADMRDRVMRLKEELVRVKGEYDFVLIDCPPSLGMVTLNALSACDSLIIPIQCEYYALEGLSQLVTTVRQVKRLYNPGIEIEGVLLTMYDGRLNLTLQVVDEVKKYFPEKVFKNVIPRNVRLSEAPSFGQPVLYFDRSSRGSQAYEALTAEILDKNRKG